MIIKQFTTLVGTCSNCGTDNVRQVDVVDTVTGRTLHIVCEACLDDEGDR